MHRFEKTLACAWSPDTWSDVSVVVGVSGGADSVALLRGLLAIRRPGVGKLSVAHFHHGLRGAEADEDARFVARLCATWSIDFDLGHAAAPAADQPPGAVTRKDESSVPIAGSPPAPRNAHSEERLRASRLRYLREVAHRRGARYVVLAHTADDQAETILQRIFRGTALAGLKGIPRARQLSPLVTLLRPLLEVRRRDLREYLAELGQPYRNDSSNRDSRYTRNRIRRQLVPWLRRSLNPRVTEAVLRLGQQATETDALLASWLDVVRAQVVVAAGPDWLELDSVALAQQSRPAVRHLLVALWNERGWPAQAMDFARWEALAEFAGQRAGSESGSGADRRLCLPGLVVAEHVAKDRLRLFRRGVDGV